MAKGRRSRSGKRSSKAGGQDHSQPRSPRPDEATDDVVDRIDALKGQLQEARAEADTRDQAAKQPERPRAKKAVAAAEGTAVVTAPVPEAGGLSGEGASGAGAAGVDEGGEPEVPEPPLATGAPPAATPRLPFNASQSTLGATTIPPRPELRPPYPRPRGSGRRRWAAFGGLAILVVAGVVIGSLAASSGGGRSRQSPIAAYLTRHVPAGTPVALMGPVDYAIPSSYPTVPVPASDLSAASGVRFAVAPDPLTSAGPEITSYVLGHASLVVSDRGRASLWAIGTSASPPTTVRTRTGPTSGPSVPATVLVPGGSPGPSPPVPLASPPVRAPAASPPVSSRAASPPASPPTVSAPASPPTVPAAPTTGAAPAAQSPAPAATTPAPAGQSPAPAAGTPATVTVEAGQSFWSIAQTVVQQRLGANATTAQIGQYWSVLVAANSGHLPVPGNPNLIYPGTTVVLPAG